MVDKASQRYFFFNQGGIILGIMTKALPILIA